MSKLEWVKIMTREEIQSHYNYFKAKKEKNDEKVKSFLNENKNRFIELYHDYERECIEDKESRVKRRMLENRLFSQKKCTCGGNLRLISNSFYGCDNYRNKGVSHVRTFPANYRPNFDFLSVKINNTWATIIARRFGVTRYEITTTLLVDFYLRNGLEDLRVKYGYDRTTKESASGFVTARSESKKQEAEIEQFFNDYFVTVNSQMYIRYKKPNEFAKVKIPDLIVSNDSSVYLFEIKLHQSYIDDEQLLFYGELIKELMSKARDSRKLRLGFITKTPYDINSFKNGKVIFTEDLFRVKNKQELINYINLNSYDNEQ